MEEVFVTLNDEEVKNLDDKVILLKHGKYGFLQGVGIIDHIGPYNTAVCNKLPEIWKLAYEKTQNTSYKFLKEYVEEHREELELELQKQKKELEEWREKYKKEEEERIARYKAERKTLRNWFRKLFSKFKQN